MADAAFAKQSLTALASMKYVFPQDYCAPRNEIDWSSISSDFEPLPPLDVSKRPVAGEPQSYAGSQSQQPSQVPQATQDSDAQTTSIQVRLLRAPHTSFPMQIDNISAVKVSDLKDRLAKQLGYSEDERNALKLLVKGKLLLDSKLLADTAVMQVKEVQAMNIAQ